MSRPHLALGPAGGAATPPSGRAPGRSPHRPRAAPRPRPALLRIRRSAQHLAGQPRRRVRQRRLQAQHPLGPHVVVDGDTARIQRVGQRHPVRVVRLLVRSDLHAGQGRGRAFGLGDLELGHDQHRFAFRWEDERREPFERLRVVAGQVAKVRSRRHDEQVEACGRQGRLGTLDARGHVRGHGLTVVSEARPSPRRLRSSRCPPHRSVGPSRSTTARWWPVVTSSRREGPADAPRHRLALLPRLPSACRTRCARPTARR